MRSASSGACARGAPGVWSQSPRSGRPACVGFEDLKVGDVRFARLVPLEDCILERNPRGSMRRGRGCGARVMSDGSERVKSIFLAAIERFEPDQWSAFLEQE